MMEVQGIKTHINFIRADFAPDETCHWETRQIGNRLGLIINKERFEFCISEDRINKLYGM